MRANTPFVSFSMVALMAVAAITPVAGAGSNGGAADVPPQETMTPEELETWLATWEDALTRYDLRDLSEAMRRVTQQGRFLRYDNPEIKEEILGLYRVEMENRRRLHEGASMADIGIEVPELDDHHEPWELYQDYLDQLVPLAVYTYSPEIYDEVLTGGYVGGERYAYLSTVNPERTLDLLLRSTLRERGNRAPQVLDFPMPDVAYHLSSAFRLLDALCDRSPEVVLAEQDRVLQFVEQYALHYTEPMEVSYRDEPRYLATSDYRMRRLALRMLDLLAETADIYNVVDDIMRDAPEPPHGAGPNEVIRKGEELIERIQPAD